MVHGTIAGLPQGTAPKIEMVVAVRRTPSVADLDPHDLAVLSGAVQWTIAPGVIGSCTADGTFDVALPAPDSYRVFCVSAPSGTPAGRLLEGVLDVAGDRAKMEWTGAW